MSDLRINHLETKAELLLRAASDREHALAEAAGAPDWVRAKAIALAAFEERKDAICRNLSHYEIQQVTLMAFGGRADASGRGES